MILNPEPEQVLNATIFFDFRPGFGAKELGDTTFDMEMSRAAGVRAIGVSWGYHEPAELLAAGAACVADDIDALEGYLRNAP